MQSVGVNQSLAPYQSSDVQGAPNDSASGQKAWWNNRAVKVLVVGAGVIATAATLAASCLIAGAILGTITLALMVGCVISEINNHSAKTSISSSGSSLESAKTSISSSESSLEVSADPYHLQRFLDAQQKGTHGSTHKVALKEMQDGQKKTHWSWYELPVTFNFGESDRAGYFALFSLDEVRAYYKHPVLRKNLLDMLTTINNSTRSSARALMGNSTDAAKLKSCASIFFLVTNDITCAQTLNKFFGGSLCSKASRAAAIWGIKGY